MGQRDKIEPKKWRQSCFSQLPPQCLLILLSHFQPIAQLVHGFNAAGANFPPQPLDMHIHGAEIPDILISPNHVQQVLPAVHPARENLLNVVWGYEYIGDYRTVDVHVRRLREKLELDPANPEYIRTKWGVGYYLAN